jgi:hypothetical protein
LTTHIFNLAAEFLARLMSKENMSGTQISNPKIFVIDKLEKR